MLDWIGFTLIRNIVPWTTALVGVLIIVGVSIAWTDRRGAPWVPTPMVKVHRMLELAGVGPGDVVFDLGCGDGRTIIAAARRFGAKAVGIEVDPLRFIWCQALTTVLGLRRRVRVVFGDFFKADLSAATVLTCYLLPNTNTKLQDKLLRDLKPDARVVSHAFLFSRLRLLRYDDQHKLYLYSPQDVDKIVR